MEEKGNADIYIASIYDRVIINILVYLPKKIIALLSFILDENDHVVLHTRNGI
jgi:hypothetical protein